MSTIVSLPRDILHALFDFLPGDSSINLLRSGDRTLWLKLATLKRLRIVLGQSGGFLSFNCVYALLPRFSALESLSISAFDLHQLCNKKLKPRRLPTSLKSLTLAFHDAVYSYINNERLFSSLPNLTALDLQQTRHKSIREGTSAPLLSLASIPASIHSLRIMGAFGYFYHADLELLSKNLVKFECDSRLENDGYARVLTHLDLSRFQSLASLDIVFGAFVTLSSSAYPSTITSLSLGGLGNSFDRTPDFQWSRAFPLLRSLHVTTPDVQIRWSWLLEMPISMRHITGHMQSFDALSEAERCDFLITLTARNDNYKSGILPIADQTLLVPALLRTLKASPLPLALIPIFTEIEELAIHVDSGASNDPINLLLHQTAFDGVFDMGRLKQLSFTGPAQLLRIPRNMETGKERSFPSTLESFRWIGTSPLPLAFWNALPSTIRELDMVQLPIETPKTMKRFTCLTSICLLESDSDISSAELNDLLPDSVTLLDINWLEPTEPLRLPNLTSLAIHSSGVHLSWISTLPSSLTKLKVKLREPIDVSKPEHQAALLSFPRNLKRLRLKKGPDFMVAGGSLTGGLMRERNRIVNGKYVASVPNLRQLSEESTYLELMTRNLNLIRFEISMVDISGTYGPLSYEARHHWLSVRIPFYRLFNREPVSSRALSTDSYYQKRVNALGHTNISFLKSLSSGTFSRFQQLYYGARGMVEPGLPSETARQKIKIRASSKLHWHWLTLYYLTTIAIYGARCYMGYQTFVGRLWNGPKLDLSFGGFTQSPRASLTTFQHLYIDLNFASSVIGLPIALMRLRKEKFSKWSRACPSPQSRYFGTACFALGVVMGLPYTPVSGFLFPVVALVSELIIFQSASWLNFAGSLGK